MNGQVASQVVLILTFLRDLCRPELYGGILGGVQEIGAQQVLVAIRFAGIDGIDLDLGGNSRASRARLIKRYGAAQFSSDFRFNCAIP
jgi:hypothetical protein